MTVTHAIATAKYCRANANNRWHAVADLPRCSVYGGSRITTLCGRPVTINETATGYDCHPIEAVGAQTIGCKRCRKLIG